MDVVNLAGRRVVVMGWGPSARVLIPVLKNEGAQVTLFDRRDGETLQRILSSDDMDLTGVSIESQELSLRSQTEADTYLMMPGAVMSHELENNLRARGAVVMCEAEFVRRRKPAVQWISIAGTNGKTTTAVLLDELLSSQNRRVMSNVDVPLAQALVEDFDIVIARLDLTQLMYLDTLESSVRMLLNIHPEHPDLLPNTDALLACYQRYVRSSHTETLNVINAGDSRIAMLFDRIMGRKLFFSTKELPEVWEGAWVAKADMMVRRTLGMEADAYGLGNFRLRGDHNRENLMAAVMVAMQFGVTRDAIQKVIDEVRAPRHRVQFVKRFNSVAFYDDAAASNVDALVRTLHAFKEPIILIAGGRDKGADYQPLIPHIRQKVKNLILVGEAKEAINRVIGDFTETFIVGTLEEAVMISYQKSRSGDVILFSPACDHSDQFASVEAKGEAFQALVDQMTKPRQRTVFY